MIGLIYQNFVTFMVCVVLPRVVNPVTNKISFNVIKNSVTTSTSLPGLPSKSRMDCASVCVKENCCSVSFSEKDKLCFLTPSEKCFDGLTQASEEGWVTMMAISKKEIIKTKMNYLDAQAYCQSEGGNLASFRNPYEYEAIVAMLKDNSLWNSHLWIGGSDRQQEGLFIWEGTSDELPNDPKYWLGVDNLNNQDCLIILDYLVPGEFKFSDVPCTNTFFFICEFRRSF